MFDGRPTALWTGLSNVTVTVTANPSQGGTVTGSGTYPVCSSQQISAAANSGWTFTGWSDGSTNNPYTITIPGGDATYTANFTSATPTASFVTTGPLNTTRYFHTATLLPNGKVLVAGGYAAALLFPARSCTIRPPGRGRRPARMTARS